MTHLKVPLDGFSWNLCLSVFRKTAPPPKKKIHIGFKPTRTTGILREDMHTFVIIPSRMKTFFGKIGEKNEKNFLFNNKFPPPPKNVPL